MIDLRSLSFCLRTQTVVFMPWSKRNRGIAICTSSITKLCVTHESLFNANDPLITRWPLCAMPSPSSSLPSLAAAKPQRQAQGAARRKHERQQSPEAGKTKRHEESMPGSNYLIIVEKWHDTFWLSVFWELNTPTALVWNDVCLADNQSTKW